MKQRILITGLTGFVGSHLAEFLLGKSSYEVYGILRWRSKLENIAHIKRGLHLHECDLRDAAAVTEVIRAIRPSVVFHLAAQSFVHTSWRAPSETLSTNILGQVNLLEAIRLHAPKAIIHIAGSSEEYGLVLPSELPIKETNPLRPLSPYAVSKVTQDLLGFQYFRSYHMRIIRTRSFNTTGPRRGEVFAESNFAKQIVEIDRGLKPPVIRVGNLEAKRDYTDVRDIVRAYHLAVTKGVPGEVYNICSGQTHRMYDVLHLLLRLSRVKARIRLDPSRIRPSDVAVLRGDNTKFTRLTGWRPTIPFTQTLTDLLEYWRRMIPIPKRR